MQYATTACASEGLTGHLQCHQVVEVVGGKENDAVLGIDEGQHQIDKRLVGTRRDHDLILCRRAISYVCSRADALFSPHEARFLSGFWTEARLAGPGSLRRARTPACLDAWLLPRPRAGCFRVAANARCLGIVVCARVLKCHRLPCARESTPLVVAMRALVATMMGASVSWTRCDTCVRHTYSASRSLYIPRVHLLCASCCHCLMMLLRYQQPSVVVSRLMASSSSREVVNAACGREQPPRA